MKSASSFRRNLSWLATGELMVRVSRLITTLILACCLSLQDYGLAALALATAEIVRILAANGIGNLIVKAEEHKLGRVSQTVFWLNLSIGIVMFALQFFLAPLIADLYQSPVLASLLQALAFSHLIYPFAMVQFNLLQRDSRMKEAGLIMGATVTMDNLISAALALSGFGVWSVIWPKLFAAVVWVVVINRRIRWVPKLQFSLQELVTARRYSGGVLLAECLKNGRGQFDLFILGRLLPADLFGLYAFARNAGLGISLSLTNSFNTALLPKLCDTRREGGALELSYYSSLKTAMRLIAPVILCQALLAPLYVPLLFGEKWAPASVLVALLCLSAVPRMVFESASMYFRAADNLRGENHIAVAFTALFCAVIAASSFLGAQAVALAMIICYLGGAWAVLVMIHRAPRGVIRAPLSAAQRHCARRAHPVFYFPLMIVALVGKLPCKMRIALQQRQSYLAIIFKKYNKNIKLIYFFCLAQRLQFPWKANTNGVIDMQAIKNQVSSAYLIFISSLFMPTGLSLRKFLRSGYKRSYDIVLSGGLLLLLSPLLVVTAAAILFESRGPIFFRQQRVGKNGEQFSIYKFRSMCTDRALHRQVESMSGDRDGICKKFVNDPRVTRVGQFIRKYSIDELPQLINVLRGEMSMIGPRPALPAEVAQYSEYQRGRLKALPGISGLWQVSGRADLNFDQQVELDLQYIRQQSLATDLRIALKTVPAVLSGSGAY